MTIDEYTDELMNHERSKLELLTMTTASEAIRDNLVSHVTLTIAYPNAPRVITFEVANKQFYDSWLDVRPYLLGIIGKLIDHSHYMKKLTESANQRKENNEISR